MKTNHALPALCLLAACSTRGTDTNDSNGTDTVDTNDTTDTVDPSACGTCPDGSTCGAANGLPVCRDTDTAIPRFSHVFIVMMENTTGQRLLDSTAAPYLHGLIASGAYGANYHGVEHPSLSNYIALMSGQIEDNGPLDCDCEPEGDACDTISCSILTHSCGCPQPHQQLVDELEPAGVTWRAYAEGMGTACNLVGSGDYAPKHVPFLYFPAFTNDATRCADHVVPFESNFAADLAAGPRDFSFIVPDLKNDMHDPIISGDSNLGNGDSWLASHIPAILASPAYTDNGLLIIAWDENDLSGVIHNDEPIPFVLMSPLAKHGGYSSAVSVDHYDLLATLEDTFGVARLGESASATPLVDFFPAQ